MRIAVLILAGLLAGCTAPQDDALDLGEALRVDTTGYARADGPRDFSFPADHGPHPGYYLEWWYFTGHLFSENQRRFGYQFTVFRTALRPPSDEANESPWDASQLYTAHFAVSDVGAGAFRAEERASRPGPGLAGAVAQDSFRVWVEDWEVAGPADLNPLHLRARQAEGPYGLNLTLRPTKPIVLQGDRGFSPKGYEEGQASYYYTMPRWDAEGWVLMGKDSLRVSGASWLDREWSTSLLSEDQKGWDWFSLQLDDGYDLMYFQLRSEGARPFVEGTRIDPRGERVAMDPEQYQLEVTREWQNASGTRYPAGWVLTGPETRLEIRPVQDDQELPLTIRYWEGAVDVAGSHQGRETAGRGYVELTGYASQEGS